MKLSPVFDTDSYKPSHYMQYPPGTDYMFSYIESRGGKYDETVFFGLQYILKEYVMKGFKLEDVAKMRDLCKAHGIPFNEAGWGDMYYKYSGQFPVKIRAVPEGTVLKTSNIMMSIESTDPEFFWIVSWLETMLLRVWYPITVATTSYKIKGLIRKYMEMTCDSTDGLLFKLHDFGSRGVSSQESAGIGGMAHLVNFMGSDTIPALLYASEYYSEDMAGFSIPASEHSSITSWGRANELDACRNMLDQFPTGLVACVSDSYDIFNCVENIWGGALKNQVLSREGTLVIRPDSGDPATVVLRVIKLLDQQFGTTINSKGYKVLPPQVRVIQGDGVEYDSIHRILNTLALNGYSADNIAFGMGGALLQKVDRDTQKFAMKCSLIRANGEYIDVYKEPVTDPGKKSKRGRLDLVDYGNGPLTTQVDPFDGHLNPGSLMQTVYENGKLLVDDTFANIRARAT
jgi:nicotinamide phosphoribosyltransferase